jgi:hypothetical protein
MSPEVVCVDMDDHFAKRTRVMTRKRFHSPNCYKAYSAARINAAHRFSVSRCDR